MFKPAIFVVLGLCVILALVSNGGSVAALEMTVYEARKELIKLNKESIEAGFCAVSISECKLPKVQAFRSLRFPLRILRKRNAAIRICCNKNFKGDVFYYYFM